MRRGKKQGEWQTKLLGIRVLERHDSHARWPYAKKWLSRSRGEPGLWYEARRPALTARPISFSFRPRKNISLWLAKHPRSFWQY